MTPHGKNYIMTSESAAQCDLTLCSSFIFFFSFIFQMLCLIGEAFDEYSDEICGAVVNIRNKGDKLGLWTADAQHGEAIKKIG